MIRIKFSLLFFLFGFLDNLFYYELGEDIKRKGFLEPITSYKGKILDGRNRYLTCKMVDIKPKFRKLNENIDPYDYVFAEKLKKRRMNSAQIAEVALKIVQFEEEHAKTRQKHKL